ncbi:MAG: ribonuclease III [Clostridium sp.]
MYKQINSMDELEKYLSISFNNKSILKIALTHSSYANQKRQVEYNERLEYLGDAVLELTITEYLFRRYKEKSEGDLTKIRSLIVCENSLYEIAQNLSLGKYMLMSKGEELTGGRERNSILADCVEALIAAIYLDSGLEAARDFIIINFKDIMERAVSNKIILDYKTKLQEVIQSKGEISITYNLINSEGPAHRPTFEVELIINGETKSRGVGFSKKEAEQNAAKILLETMENRESENE